MLCLCRKNQNPENLTKLGFFKNQFFSTLLFNAVFNGGIANVGYYD